MSNIKTLASITSLVGAGLLIGWWLWPATPTGSDPLVAPKTCPDFNQGRLTVNDIVFSVGFARTAEAKNQGLSGCPDLSPDVGLVFPFNPAKQATFWMKDMLISIDIIWIKDGQIIGIESNVPIPLDASGGGDVPIYQAPAPVDAVLEIAAGTAQNRGLRLGDTVTIDE